MAVNGAFARVGDQGARDPTTPLSPDEVDYPRTHPAGIEEEGGSDFGFAVGGIEARFRAAIFHQKDCVSIVLRDDPRKLLSFEHIGLPPKIAKPLRRPRGLILVTGPTGSGKTTTLGHDGQLHQPTRDRHIITIEDPIEYYHRTRSSS